MSDIVGELARVREAFDKPTLRLLDRKWAPLVLAVFTAPSAATSARCTAERLHTQVDTYLDELRRRGETSSRPTLRAGAVRAVDERPVAVPHHRRQRAGGVLPDLARAGGARPRRRLSRERALISESRINTILDAVRRWATEANPDRQARIERLDAQIRQLTAERDSCSPAAGEIAPPPTTGWSTATPT